MTEEVRFFRRISIYALIVGVIYWFVSYEWIGTTLLIVFGVGGSAGTLLLWRGARERAAAGMGSEPSVAQGSEAAARMGLEPAAGTGSEAALVEAQGPFADETGRLPESTAAPLLLGIAVALAGLGLVFGPWFLLVAVVPFAAGAGSWLGGVRGELAGVEMDDAGAKMGDADVRRRGQDAEALGETDGAADGAAEGAADGAALPEPDGGAALSEGTGEGVGSGVKTPAAPKSRP